MNISAHSWLGAVDNGTIIAYTEHCPPGYCLPNTTINIIHRDIICRENPMGWLIFWLNIIWPYSIPSSVVGTPFQYMVYLHTSIKYQ